MTFTQKAFQELYTDREADITLEYSGRLKKYGCNVTYDYRKKKFHFKISKKWMIIDEDIKIGLIQSLFLKVFKDKRKVFHVDLYNNFIKNLHIAIPKDDIDPILKESFDRVNEKYFIGMVDVPNLVFGKNATTTLGHYDYKADKITISNIFKKKLELIDFIMYHEMLHKVHKFKPGLKTRYHSPKFKKAEKQFEEYEYWDKELEKFLKMKRIKGFFGF